MEEIEALRKLLTTVAIGAVSDGDRADILNALRPAWSGLDGSSETRMDSDKLHRAENLQWDGRFLIFDIARHGAIVLGSSREEVHRWSVDVENGTAEVEEVVSGKFCPQHGV
jgi:hypothetical protein